MPAQAHHDDLPRLHWPSPAAITVYDRLNSPHAQAAINAWNQASPRMQLTRVAGGTRTDCTKIDGAIVVCVDPAVPGGFGSSTAFGGTQHIGAVIQAVNQYDGDSMGMWVHELGHSLGLGHHDVAPGVSVMWRGAGDLPLMPNAADLASIRKLYEHQDGPAGQPMPGARRISRVDLPSVSLNVPGGSVSAGQQFIQYPWTGGYASEKWVIETMGDGTYRIFNLNSQLAMDAFGTAAGDAIGQWDWYGGPRQRWFIEPRGAGFQFRNQASGLCLTPAGFATGAAAMLQWACSGAPSQIWGAPPA